MTESQPNKMPGLTEEQERWIAVWTKVEDVAMHFNEMIMSYRLKAVGGVSLAAGLVGTILLGKGNDGPTVLHYTIFGLALLFLLAMWAAICAIDIFYYQKLLSGAVVDAIRLEKQSEGTLQLSTNVSLQFGERGRSFKYSRLILYGLPALVLAGGAALSFRARVHVANATQPQLGAGLGVQSDKPAALRPYQPTSIDWLVTKLNAEERRPSFSKGRNETYELQFRAIGSNTIEIDVTCSVKLANADTVRGLIARARVAIDQEAKNYGWEWVRVQVYSCLGRE